MLLRFLFRLCLPLSFACMQALVFAQAPVNNPYAAFRNDHPEWTDALKWANVTDISQVVGITDKAGNVDSSILYQLMDKVARQGGGVLYFPPGRYYFAYDLRLAGDVILRGAEPSGSREAKQKDYTLSTLFEFPKYEPVFTGAGQPNSTAFKAIYADKSGVTGFGLVNISINRAHIDLYTNWPKQYHDSVVLFGLRVNNSCIPEVQVPSSIQSDEGYGWVRWPSQSVGAIEVCVDNHLAVVNCKINDAITDNFEMPAYMTNDGYVFRKETEPVSFRQSYHRGMGIFRHASGDSSDVEVRDNYILSSRYLAKISKTGKGIIERDNLVIDTDEPEYRLIAKHPAGQLAIKLQFDAQQFFPTQRYISGRGDTTYYGLLKPAAAKKGVKYPLLLFFHGSGEKGEDKNHAANFVQIFTTAAARKDFPCYVLLPHLPTAGDWHSKGLDQEPSIHMVNAIALMRKVIAEHPDVDTSRLYVGGISSGAVGAWEASLRYPGLFAVMLGMGCCYDIREHYYPNIKNKIFVTAGLLDTSVPIAYSRLMISRLKRHHIDVSYREFPVGHFSWVPLYQDATFLPWLFSQRKM